MWHIAANMDARSRKKRLCKGKDSDRGPKADNRCMPSCGTLKQAWMQDRKKRLCKGKDSDRGPKADNRCVPSCNALKSAWMQDRTKNVRSIYKPTLDNGPMLEAVRNVHSTTKG